jgi:hypothetical protein
VWVTDRDGREENREEKRNTVDREMQERDEVVGCMQIWYDRNDEGTEIETSKRSEQAKRRKDV